MDNEALNICVNTFEIGSVGVEFYKLLWYKIIGNPMM